MITSCSASSSSFSTHEPHTHMTAIAVRLVVRGATAAERQVLGLADGATRAAYNFQIAGDGQRAILCRGRMATGPLRVSSGVTSPVGGSPVAMKLATLWEPSQNGLFCE